MNERGNVALELIVGFSLFVSLLMPAIVEFSNVIQTHQRLHNYLGVLGRGWSMAESQQAETTLKSLQSALSIYEQFTMKYSCEPHCSEPDAKLRLKITMRVESLLIRELSVKGEFARDSYSQ